MSTSRVLAVFLVFVVLPACGRRESTARVDDATAARRPLPSSDAMTPPTDKHAAPPPTSGATRTKQCLLEITRERSRSVLAEHRSLTTVPDFHAEYTAEYIDPDTFTPVKLVSQFTIGGGPILYFNEGNKAAVVNAAAISALKAVDVPKLTKGTRARIGGLTELGRGKITPRRLLEFLIHADVLRTYWHIESRVCLRSESNAGGTYHAILDGIHTYFTNEKNEDEFSFEVWISADGVIDVAAR